MRQHGKAFEPEMRENLNEMLNRVDDAFHAMLANLNVPAHTLRDISNAEHAEGAINTFRNQLREEHINNLESAEYNYQTGVYYIDIVYELEKMGDYMINVSQAIVKENEPLPALA
jgi:phosphate:Na+ symporter